MNTLSGRRILIMSTFGFEDAELYIPRQTLLDAAAQVVLAAPTLTEIRGVNYDSKTGNSDVSEVAITPDMVLDDINVTEFDALILPGGVVNPDKLRMEPLAIALIKDFVEAGKPVAAICHAPWLLIEADVVRGRKTTGWYSILTDLRNAGSTVVDEEVVVDGNIITSRMPSDIPAFTQAIVASLVRH
ncbi:peptidase C56 [Metarhizobium album]|uniref:Peptidase C56 n=1 Tax=Metarhizobium album TaxID=2182425 RepID=A0A2U2DJ97_9HYPH|nr:type 1 glutamine amidotransferase domain-containing protein [Rhizobium album]PWE53374.1 peptidase C56 [Rhizobium album]